MIRSGIAAACAALVALCSGCSSEQPAPQTPASTTVAAEVECPASDPDAAGVLANPADFDVTPINPSDIGPGLAGPDVIDEFCEVAAAEFSPKNAQIVGGPDGAYSYVVLRALVGTVKADGGDAFVDSFLSRLGPEARNGTVTLGGRVVQHFVTPERDGYAYADGSTVAIGFITPLRELRVLDEATTQEPAKSAFTRILAAAAGAPIPADERTESGRDTYPLARGRYTSADDPGWIFFTTEGGTGCGIGPGGTVAGCDMAPDDAPEGTNQTVVDGSAPARYTYSDTTTFTRDADALLPGHRLENGAAVCSIGYQGPVSCHIGPQGFTVTGLYGSLE